VPSPKCQVQFRRPFDCEAPPIPALNPGQDAGWLSVMVVEVNWPWKRLSQEEAVPLSLWVAVMLRGGDQSVALRL